MFTGAYIAYLMRYVLAFCFVFAAAELLIRALKSLRYRFKQQLIPASGYFLLSQIPDREDAVETYSLYHTTTIGTARRSDVRIRDKLIERTHAIVYLYNGRWYIRPVSNSAITYINGRQMKKERRLKNGDIIGLGSRQLVFIDERSTAEKSGLSFEEVAGDWQQGRGFEQPIKTLRPWIFTLLFMFAGIATVGLRIDDNVKDLAPVYWATLGGFAFLAIIGYFVWPRLFYNFDRGIYVSVILLSSLGLILQARFAFIGRLKPDDWTQDFFLSYVQRDYLIQAGVAIIGLIMVPVVIWLVSRTRFLENIAIACMVITPLIYIATKILGRGAEDWGASLWIGLPGGFSIQLTEFAKITYLIVLAQFFKNRPTLKMQLLFAGWAGMNFILIMMLPDLGTMMVLLPTTLFVYLTMTSEYLKTGALLVGGSLIFYVAYLTMNYVQVRIHGWLSLWTEVNAYNEQIIRGLQAIGRGGVLGRGLGNGNPRSIPLFNSDTVFAAMTEETGLLISLAVVVLFIVLWLRSAQALLRVRDGFTSGLMLAIGTMFFVEAAVVIGGTTGLIPLTGATLPFIAKGGSSMLAKWLMFGMLLGLYGRREEGAYKTVKA